MRIQSVREDFTERFSHERIEREEQSGTEAAIRITGGISMLLTIAIILLVLWLAGLVAFHVTAWFIHLLIVVAIIMFVLHFVRGRSAPR